MKVPSVEVMLQHLQAAARHRVDAGIDQIDNPGRVRDVQIAGGILLAEDLALDEIDPQIALVLAELGHVSLDRIAHVSQRQHEMVVPVGRVVLHDVP
jgi:hypothetical protein